MANQVFDPNWLQRMFTPKGYGYQWQNRPDQGGGEFTGHIPGVYEGDAQDLRMVPKVPIAATPRNHDFYGGQPGEMSPMSPPVASVPAEESQIGGGYQGIVNEDALPVAGFVAPNKIQPARYLAEKFGGRSPHWGLNINPKVSQILSRQGWLPGSDPAPRGPGAVPSSGHVRPPTGPTSGPYNTRPIGMGADAGARFNAALNTQQSHASGGRGATVQAGGYNAPVDDVVRNDPHRNWRRYTGTHNANTGGEPLNAAESESQRWQREVEARRAGRAAGGVVAPEVVEAGESHARGAATGKAGRFSMTTNVPAWLSAKGGDLWRGGSRLGGAALKGLGGVFSGVSRGASAAMYTNLMAEIMGTEDLPPWAQEVLGQRTGLLNRDLSPDERLEENARLSDLASIAENKGNIELANEIRSQIEHDNLTGLGFAIDPRAWAESDVLGNIKSYYGNMFEPNTEPMVPSGLSRRTRN